MSASEPHGSKWMRFVSICLRRQDEIDSNRFQIDSIENKEGEGRRRKKEQEQRKIKKEEEKGKGEERKVKGEN